MKGIYVTTPRFTIKRSSIQSIMNNGTKVSILLRKAGAVLVEGKLTTNLNLECGSEEEATKLYNSIIQQMRCE